MRVRASLPAPQSAVRLALPPDTSGIIDAMINSTRVEEMLSENAGGAAPLGLAGAPQAPMLHGVDGWSGGGGGMGGGASGLAEAEGYEAAASCIVEEHHAEWGAGAGGSPSSPRAAPPAGGSPYHEPFDGERGGGGGGGQLEPPRCVSPFDELLGDNGGGGNGGARGLRDAAGDAAALAGGLGAMLLDPLRASCEELEAAGAAAAAAHAAGGHGGLEGLSCVLDDGSGSVAAQGAAGCGSPSKGQVARGTDVAGAKDQVA